MVPAREGRGGEEVGDRFPFLPVSLPFPPSALRSTTYQILGYSQVRLLSGPVEKILCEVSEEGTASPASPSMWRAGRRAGPLAAMFAFVQ